MRNFAKVALVLFVYFGAVAPSKAFDIDCPKSINETPSINGVVAGWEVVEEQGERPLDQVGIYLFHPSQKGAQVPDATKRVRNEERVTWRIVRGKHDEFWIGCHYHGTTAILARKLDSNIAQCVAQYDLLQTGNRLRLKRVSCE